MASKVCIAVLVVLLINLSYNGIVGNRLITKEEELEIEKQLKVLNKRPIKSIRSKAGDIFDCIDINQQPALEHPLLKNHKVQIKPTLLPKGGLEVITSQTKKSRLPFIDCPKGTVPIRRTLKEDLVRAKRFTNIRPLELSPGLSRAFVITNPNPADSEPMFGGKGKMNLINPKVQADQSSSSLISVDYGPVDDLNFTTLEAGWTVSPKLYGDSKTRFTTFWQSTTNGAVGGCYNVFCPGFVHVDKSIPLNSEFSGVSTYDGEQFEFQVAILQDKSTKDWWLTIPDASRKIGYWPNAIVPHLTDGANRISWGGVTRTFASGTSPPMGFAKLPDRNIQHSGYFLECRVFDRDGQESVPRNTDILVDNDDCYNVLQSTEYKDGRSFTYGGPGGECKA